MAIETVTQFYIEGMKCDGCIANVKQALSELPGYIDAEFDLAGGTGTVKGDIDPQAVSQAMTQAGYPAVVKSA